MSLHLLRPPIGFVIAIVLLIGCKPAQTPQAVINGTPEIKRQNEIVDRLQRRVPIQPAAKRIVSLSPAATELLFALDLGESVVGATEYCNYPPQALQVPRMGGGTLESISSEAILRTKPDLVLCKSDTHQPLLESLERMNIRVCAVGAQSMEELFEQADWIGRLTNHEQESDKLVAKMRDRHAQLMALVSDADRDRPLRVFYEVWDDPLMTAAPNSFIGELMTMAGLENIVSDTSIRYPRISSETVVRGDPELILAPTSHTKQIEIDSFKRRPGWENVSAVANARIRLISADQVSRCGPRILDALAEIIQAAYPDINAGIENRIDATDQVEEAVP